MHFKILGTNFIYIRMYVRMYLLLFQADYKTFINL